MKLFRADHGSGKPLTFVHGFTQTGSSWEPVLNRLGDGYRSTTVDAPGHGRSPDGRRTLIQCAGDIHETMPQSVLVGYSMGARMSLLTAVYHPEKIDALVLISGTPGIADPSERQTRRHNDELLADRIESIGVPAFIEEWLALPMFSGLQAHDAQRELRLTNTASGLADSLRHAGTGTQIPVSDDQLGGLSCPVLLVTGSLDSKFTDIAFDLQKRIPRSEHVVVKGVGHTVHLEAPDQFVAVLREWLSRTEGGIQAN